MELLRQKNAQTVLVFPILNTTGTHVSGASALTASRSAWTDTTAPSSFANLTNATPVELSSRGVYYVTVTATEMNADYIYIYVTTTSAGSIAQNLLLVTKPIHSVTSVDWSQLDNKTSPVALTNTTISTVTASVVPDWKRMINADAVVALSGTTINSVTNVTVAHSISSPLIVTTNNDKTGYSIGAGGIGATSFAAGAIDSAAIAAGAIVSTTAVAGFYNQAADLLLARNIKGGSSTGRRIYEALAALRNRSAIVGNTLTVYDTDDLTTLWTVTITTTTAVSISDMDPT